MKLSSLAQACGRRVVVCLSAAAMLGAATAVFAQAAPAPAQAPAAGTTAAPAAGQAAAPAAPDAFKFTTDAGGIIWYVKADKTADFEAVWDAIRTKLAASDNPDLKAMSDGLKIYKLQAAPNAAPTDDVMYLFVADPASKTISYSPSPYLLFTSKLFTDAEGRDLFNKLSASITKISPMALDKVK